jgi:multidrug efflux pump subunit AcrA (membrane-fusion protein)
VATQELKRIDQEEQRQIKAQMREEAKVQREAEKIRRQAEKEERMVRKAMAQAEKRLAAAADQERLALEEEIAKLKDQLLEAEAKGERAISMAQQTKQGHIYIISNPGSFGEEVIKIGMTRRLEPMDRVKELGDASVPFMFDVHAIIHSDDAPSLENELHQCFHNTRVNKVNIRKEFFRAPLTKIKGRVTELGYEAHWTMKAEALEYRESLQIEKHSIEESKNKDAQEANLESNSSHVSAI